MLQSSLLFITILSCSSSFATECFQKFLVTAINNELESRSSLVLNELRKLDELVPGEFQYKDQLTSNGFHYFEGYQRVIQEDGVDVVVGQIMMRYNNQTQSLFINDLRTSRKGQKIGTTLFLKALSQYPDVQRVQATLGLNNYRAFISSYEEHHDLIAALKSTPAYKMRKRAGFVHIDKSSIEFEPENEFITFTVQR